MLHGSCLCGAVKFEVSSEPLLMYYCHCGTCRKASGSSFATNILVAAEDFSIIAGKEKIAAFESSPKKLRHFCSACGSPLYSQAESSKQVVSIRCGTLDTLPAVQPSMHFHVSSKAPWFDLLDDLPQTLEGF